jgi:hypothetical protein
MEWLVPVLFVLASLAQWWMQRNRQGQENEIPEARPPEETLSAPPRRQPSPPEEFGDLGDLLEALGRRRHESPPPAVEKTQPPVLPSPPSPKIPPARPEPAPVSIPAPVTVRKEPKPVLPPIFTAFPEAKVAPISEPTFVSPHEETPRVTFRPFPAARKADTVSTHRWAEMLRSPESVRDAIVLSEILAPPVSLR